MNVNIPDWFAIRSSREGGSQSSIRRVSGSLESKVASNASKSRNCDSSRRVSYTQATRSSVLVDSWFSRLIALRAPACRHQTTPASPLRVSSAHAKCTATSGDAAQSKQRVGRPLCCATAITYHSDLSSKVPALAYFRKLRMSDLSTVLQ